MPLHLIKLCVGCDTVQDLEDWIKEKLQEKKKRGEKPERIHTTRMVPKRVEELLDGGSLYWVIKGQVQARQSLMDIRSFTDADGIGRCNLILAPQVVETTYQPRRAFQGWRYLQASEAPRDLAELGAGAAELPLDLRRELAELGLL
jgi:hypothetical protein